MASLLAILGLGTLVAQQLIAWLGRERPACESVLVLLTAFGARGSATPQSGGAAGDWAYDVQLEVWLQGEKMERPQRICRSARRCNKAATFHRAFARCWGQ